MYILRPGQAPKFHAGTRDYAITDHSLYQSKITTVLSGYEPGNYKWMLFYNITSKDTINFATTPADLCIIKAKEPDQNSVTVSNASYIKQYNGNYVFIATSISAITVSPVTVSSPCSISGAKQYGFYLFSFSCKVIPLLIYQFCNIWTLSSLENLSY